MQRIMMTLALIAAPFLAAHAAEDWRQPHTPEQLAAAAAAAAPVSQAQAEAAVLAYMKNTMPDPDQAHVAFAQVVRGIAHLGNSSGVPGIFLCGTIEVTAAAGASTGPQPILVIFNSAQSGLIDELAYQPEVPRLNIPAACADLAAQLHSQ
jgi:hypothetical protein